MISCSSIEFMAVFGLWRRFGSGFFFLSFQTLFLSLFLCTIDHTTSFPSEIQTSFILMALGVPFARAVWVRGGSLVRRVFGINKAEYLTLDSRIKRRHTTAVLPE